jgi:hypothetical protein
MSPSCAAAIHSGINSAVAGVIGLPPPPPLPPCRHQRHAATAATTLLPLLTPDAALPPRCPPPPSCRRHIQCCQCAASAALALPTLPPNFPPSPRCSRAASAALPMLPLRIQCCRPTATAVAVLLLPPTLYHRHRCHPVTLLPHCSSPPPLRCSRCPHAAYASAALPTIATLLPCCLHRSANAATTLPLLKPCCR